jgi:hypothetical protein
MVSPAKSESDLSAPLDVLDRIAIGYMVLPLLLFLAGWMKWWVALPLLGCCAFALRPLIARWPAGMPTLPVTPLHWGVAVGAGCVWTILGGVGHFFFSNADWHVRDAVLHDLVVSSWPVGYGLRDGMESLLRAPVAYYLPAALIGKISGVYAAHLALLLWTAAGCSLFLTQVLSLTPSRPCAVLIVIAVIVLFSGLDIVGSLLNDGPRFRSDWNITTHLEWWAGKYQYSSMTTQLFWVPNHALGGWITMGLLFRNERRVALDALLPIVVVALALWSPLTAVGVVPFVLLKVGISVFRQHSLTALAPGVWGPALAVGAVVGAFLVLDSGGIPSGLSTSGQISDVAMDLAQQAQFFLLEAGLIGAALLWIQPSSQIVLALVILALLPIASFGPGNDLVMRASIPSLVALAIGASLALVKDTTGKLDVRKRVLLGGLLALGATTAVEELARAVIVPTWPINLQATLIGVNCGGYAPHYVARLKDQAIGHLLRHVSRLPIGPQGRESCDNPGLDLMWNWNLVPLKKFHQHS